MRVWVLVVTLIGWLGAAGPAWADGRRLVPLTPPAVPGTEGRGSFAGIPGLGGPLPPSPTRPGTHPVVGSVTRTGLFVNPLTGRTRYSGWAYNPLLGRFEKYHFRQ